jgi:hypothetical protein
MAQRLFARSYIDMSSSRVRTSRDRGNLHSESKLTVCNIDRDRKLP